MVEGLPELPAGYRIRVKPASLNGYVKIKLQVPFLLLFNRTVGDTYGRPDQIEWNVRYLLRKEKERLANEEKVKAVQGVYHGS